MSFYTKLFPVMSAEPESRVCSGSMHNIRKRKIVGPNPQHKYETPLDSHCKILLAMIKPKNISTSGDIN